MIKGISLIDSKKLKDSHRAAAVPGTNKTSMDNAKSRIV
jgi:hypothetical protein